jgi:transporter family-2 protein
MKLHLYLLTALLGVVLTVHLGMNAKVGAAINNPRVGNAVFWVIGAVTAVLIGLSGWQAGALNGLKQVQPLMLTAGAIGACLVFGIAWLFPQLGGAPVMILLLAGQVIAGILISHYGWLGSPVQPMTMIKIIGALIMCGGAALVTYSK